MDCDLRERRATVSGTSARAFERAAIRTPLLRALAIALVLPVCSAAVTQEFPAKTVRMVVPFPPGGATDILARAIATPLNRALGQSVVIDNRAGASTVIGAELVMRAPADGHTLLVIAPSFSINPSVRSKMPYDTPRNVIERLSAEIDRALNLPQVRESLHKFGLVPAYLNAAEFDALIQSELLRYARIVSALKLRMDGGSEG